MSKLTDPYIEVGYETESQHTVNSSMPITNDLCTFARIVQVYRILPRDHATYIYSRQSVWGQIEFQMVIQIPLWENSFDVLMYSIKKTASAYFKNV